MSVISWSPELRHVVRDLKKAGLCNDVNVAASLSETEMKAIQKTFKKGSEKDIVLGYWQ